MSDSLLSIGQSALSNFQVALNVHGGNIANASTEGYVRRVVNFTEDTVSTSRLGIGASIQGIVRALDSFLERRRLDQTSASSYAETLSNNLSQVQSLFNDSSDTGISTLLDTYWDTLSSLASNPSDSATRTEAISTAQSLAATLADMDESLAAMASSTEDAIGSQVKSVNSILGQLADYNKAIASSDEASGLLDQRDQLLRDLAGYVDIKVTTQDDGQVRVTTAEGQTLVDGTAAYSFRLQSPTSTAALTAGSAFDGKLYFEGASSNELTIEFVTGGDCSGGATAATFKVSLDGGKTWVTDESGATATFTAGDSDHKAVVDGVSLWFGTQADEDAAPATSIAAGDKWDVMPKTGVSWVTATGGEVNVTPLAGNDAANRLSGGSLAALFTLRDEYLGSYQDSLDAFTESLVWNTNRAHSQGAGLTNLSTVLGDYAVENASVPLDQSGLHWADYLESGNLSIALYDADTGENLSVTALDFSSVTPGTSSFDPSVHSLEDVRDALNATYPGQLTASIQDGRLQIAAADGVEFQFAEDSSGLLAGLGVNTFWSGTDAGSIAVSDAVSSDPSRLCTAHVNGAGEVNSGDNTTALALSALADATLDFRLAGGISSDTIQGFMTALAAKTGSDASAASNQATYAATLLEDLDTQWESTSGVNLDEELTRVMQYQQYYQAAAKLIETAGTMFETVLALK
ncbi:Flagellar hook-associated protein 1 [Fundidesulfovibrio magnetotacticus]|uniref:Flagellar hook-associated protein 1 n=1 Tax=Fundidesulfovibrio magnetotacticus TaxID=2730080 RepID=A0A6V8LVN5_9BACT|nr:flagellar hook-associated protein FlgK [Fundidesulfovibrio magnetotacticus]GFK94368.1 Flagellar hook-associated protein 1 [Fundidesulfovibrio magnetotacticus]